MLAKALARLKFWPIAIMSLLLCVSGIAEAGQVINVVQGSNKPYPIAVVPFGSDPELSNLPDGITGVITNDLQISGRFDPLPSRSMPVQPHSADQVNWQQWNSTNIEFMVVGNVQAAGGGKYNVKVALLSVLGNQPLFNVQFSNISGSQLRSLAHYISDKIYLAITGKRGAFSTHLAYVTVTNQGTRNVTYRIIVSDADGYNPQMLLEQSGNPIASLAWSADAKQLAYVTYLHNRLVIYSIALATGKRQVIASFPGMNSAPAWSPDGKSMAMALSKGNSSQTNIYIMNLATRKLVRYTQDANNTSPYFSADGKTIAFNSDRGGQPQIYQLQLGAGVVKRLSFDGLKNYSPIYTPDGNKIIMMHQGSASGPIQIAVLDLVSGNTQVITNGDLDKSPSVSPNGDMVVYANFDKSRGVLSLVSLNGNFHLQLPSAAGSVQSPAWSPFLN
jgi:TolB protein